MPDLLLELLSEEIPARMQKDAAGQLRKRITDALVDAGLTYENAREYWTPRRITLDLRGLSPRSADITEEKKGPRTDAPQKAIEGFMRGAGITSIDEAETRSDPKKGDYYVVVANKPGRAAQEIIAEILPAIITGFNWPKSMRWGEASAQPGALRWVRPLQSILCTYGPETEDTEIIEFRIGDMQSGDHTVGHRFMAPGKFSVRRFDDYVHKLGAAKVMLDADRRAQTILTDARNLAFAQGFELVEDPGLLAETANLVEYPVVLMGQFGEEFLDIPDEVTRLTIRDNQKCFVLRDAASGKLVDRFILVSNIEATDGGVEIARGNAKVVNARLSDAKFFWQSDLQQAKGAGGFDNWINGLANVTFHAKLGSQKQRIDRIVALAETLAPIVGADPDMAKRAAYLAKADLQSAMVFEFPEVQGHMGRLYAGKAGEPAPVALAIEEHYKPLGPADIVPSDPVSVTVALADKLDTLIGFWAIDEKPTGSKDPYALRRAALGVIRLVMENEVRLNLTPICAQAKCTLDNQSATATLANDETLADLLSFFHDRLKVHLRDAGLRHDLIDAVLSPRADDLLIIAQKAHALQNLAESEDGINLLAGYKRAANILAAEVKKGTAIASTVSPDKFESDVERALFETLEDVELLTANAIKVEQFKTAMGHMARLRAPIDNFFEHVLVNAQDSAMRANRLALLTRIRDVTASVADFSKISG